MKIVNPASKFQEGYQIYEKNFKFHVTSQEKM